MFGRQARLPVDLMFNTDKPSLAAYAMQLCNSLDEAYCCVRKNMGTQLDLRRKNTWQTLPTKRTGLATLNSISTRWLRHPGTGPWKVLECLSDATYRIEHTQRVDNKDSWFASTTWNWSYQAHDLKQASSGGSPWNSVSCLMILPCRWGPATPCPHYPTTLSHFRQRKAPNQLQPYTSESWT